MKWHWNDLGPLAVVPVVGAPSLAADAALRFSFSEDGAYALDSSASVPARRRRPAGRAAKVPR